MSAQDRAIQKLAKELAGIKREVVSWRGPQADYTSIENGGNFTFKDGDGNVTAVVGGQDDGSNTIRHVDGPTPPIPSGLSAHVDGPIVQVSWDGTFEDADNATYDWSHLEVIAVGPNSENLRGTISDVAGASTNLAATSSGEWTVVARSVSRADKRSLDGDAGTVEVKLVDIDGAIEAVQDSANGKNKVTYSEYPPTAADPGIFDDTWFVGQVGRPDDVVEATNLVSNPSFETGIHGVTSQPGVTFGRETGGFFVNSGEWALRTTIPDGATAGTGVITQPIAFSPDLLGKHVAFSAALRRGNTGVRGPSHARLRIEARSGATLVAATDNVYYLLENTYSKFSVAMQVPSTGVDNIIVRIWYQGSAGYSAPQPGDSYSDSWVACSGLSESAALDSVATYFDGDTTSGTTDNESHYRWTGTPHASTSEKYLPALTIGDSDNWNIIEQYRHDGSGWVRVELSHKVFSTVDLGKATVGELDGIRIAAQTIRGQQLSGDAIDGKVITGGTYRTTGGTGSWSDDGLFIAQPDGTSMVRFPTDGSPLGLTASDVQIDRASITDLDLSFGSVRSGGQVTLASGVTAPASPPELTTGWQKVATLEKPNEGYYGAHVWEGLAYWAEGDGHWVRAVNAFTVESDPYDGFEIYDYATGELQTRRQIDINPSQGITVMGDTVYAFGQGHGSGSNRERYYIDGYDLNTGVRVSRHEYTRTIQAKNALGNDGTNLIVASVYNHELWVHRRDPVTGVQSGPDMKSGANTWPDASGSALYGVSISGSELTVIPTVAARVYSIDGGVLTWKTDAANATGYAGWTNPLGPAGYVVGAGAVPYIVDGQGTIFAGATAFPSDYTLQACFTWFDGTNETTPSPAAEIRGGAMNAYTITAPERAGLQRRMYVRPGTSGQWWRFTMPAGTVYGPIGVYGALNATLPATNSFPNADPATLKSTNDKFVVHGDGSGTWGPLTFNADGSMTSTQIPAWVPVTSFLNSASPQPTFGFAPAYRVWPDGKVEWRGNVSFPSTTGSKELLTVPTAARPTSSVHTRATTGGDDPGVCRIDICDPQSPTTLRKQSSIALTWVSLDGIYYYKD